MHYEPDQLIISLRELVAGRRHGFQNGPGVLTWNREGNANYIQNNISNDQLFKMILKMGSTHIRSFLVSLSK
jgi:hypothetical protein